jgi:NAD(P)-dependent dehydrogenase (short-subunit alcohol dehydrogenase family)
LGANEGAIDVPSDLARAKRRKRRHAARAFVDRRRTRRVIRQDFRRAGRGIVAREVVMSVVLVTGSSSGIGLATAVHFARQGWDVYAGVRNLATATELQQTITTDPLPITPVAIDVDDAGSVTRGVGEVLARAGRIDALVNNAGIGGGGPIEDVPVDWAKSLFETNYFGTIRMTQAVLPGMRERRAGVIVNVSSIAGRLAIAGHGHYSAVKHALEAASEALAQEVQAFGIRVAVVEPGVVVTPIFTKAKRFADPASPYAVHVHRLLLFYQMQMKAPSQPSDVARVIHEAVTAKEPKLRYLVGDDAERLVAGRKRLTDEEYVATGQAMSDAEYLDLMRRRYGFEW